MMEVQFNEALVPQGQLVPINAAVFYGAKDRNGRITVQFASIHGMVMTESGARLAEGVPITVAAVQRLASMAADAVKRRAEILPANVLVCNDEWLVWWRPETLDDLSFDVSWNNGAAGRERLQGVCLAMPLPPLVFALKRGHGVSGANGVFVFATDRNERPGPDAAIYRAPLLNVSDNGTVCWGDGQRPKTRNVEDVEEWERLLFSSQFTHVNGSSPVKSKEPYQWIADFCASDAKRFPVEELKPMRLSLAGLMKQLAKESA
ncbi:MAG: PRTRC system protein B [Nitrospiraceae bacterium]